MSNIAKLPAMAAEPVLANEDPQRLEEVKDYYVQEGGLVFAGRHLIIDLNGASGLSNKALIEDALVRAVEAANATLLHLHLHTFGEGGGISGVAVLSESHISIHTWPERDYAAIDAFMCGKADPSKVIPVLRDAFKPESISVLEHKRGVL